MAAGKQQHFTISELTREFDISSRTIRFYEEKGLIQPLRSESNQRVYSRRDRTRLKLILRGRRFGMSLDEIAEILGFTEANINEADQIRKALEYGGKYFADIRARIQALQAMERELLEYRTMFESRLQELTGEQPDL